MAKTAKAAPPSAPASDIYLVQFTKLCAPYNAGEVAGFSKKAAIEYIRRGVAQPYTRPTAESETITAPVDPERYAKSMSTFGTDLPTGLEIDPKTGNPQAAGVMSPEEAEALLNQTATVPPAGGPDDDI